MTTINEIKKRVEGEQEKIAFEQDKLEVLKALGSYEGRDEVITSEEALSLLEDLRKNPPKRIMTGLPSLDKLLEGFGSGSLTVLSGPTKHGKTSLAMSFTHTFAENKIPALWFSYELGQLEFLEKFGEPIPFFTVPKTLSQNTLDFIKKKILESIAKYETKIVIIDHLHFLLNENDLRRGNISSLIGILTRNLKQFAVKWGISIILICHTTKIAFDRQPSLADIRDSSFISQDSDTTLMIWRKRESKTDSFSNGAKLAVLANRRNGRTGIVELVFNENRFYEKSKLSDPLSTD